MKVNMTPNPLDVVTIHASQGDTEARQWEFELHNNGELIDTSEITEQMFFKAYKGGTEQILPENTSTPTTSPFLGDIRYPQGLLSDQEFLYRESPTEEDGLAKITDIKGNTLVWNQLLNVEAYTTNTSNGVTFTKNSNNTISITGTATGRASSTNFARPQITNGHKYLLYLSKALTNIYLRSTVGFTASVQNSAIFTATADGNGYFYFDTNATSTATFNITNLGVCLFDLTLMGLDSITVDEFTSLFPLPYYAYNQGTLLSFMGNGIKTVGKNLNPWIGVDYNASTSRTVFLKKGDYVLSTDTGNNFEGSTQIYFCLADSNGNNITNGGITSSYLSLNGSGTFYYGGYGRNNIPLTLNFDAFVSFGFNNQRPTNINEIQLEFGSTPSNYEPYTTSTTDLPISTYFPTGMKRAGSVYDELTESKAITRVGAVDLGTLNWQLERANYNVFLADVQSYMKPPINNDTVANIKCALYSTNTSVNVYNYNVDKAVGLSSGSALRIRDTSFSDANTFKQSLNGVYLYYEMITETETSFTTASLVTENAEIPLSNEDGVLIGKCTEQLSENPGFIDAKIKLSDSDGECYSNKIQLHIERSPQ